MSGVELGVVEKQRHPWLVPYKAALASHWRSVETPTLGRGKLLRLVGTPTLDRLDLPTISECPGRVVDRHLPNIRLTEAFLRQSGKQRIGFDREASVHLNRAQ